MDEKYDLYDKIIIPARFTGCYSTIKPEKKNNNETK